MFEYSVLNVKCKISVLFPAILLVLLIGDQSGVAGISFLAACLHEMGHISAAYSLRLPPKELYVSFFGMRMILTDDDTINDIDRCLIALAGPFTYALFSVVLPFFGMQTTALIHGLIASFHLLPVFPLDGGVCVNSLLACTRLSLTTQRYISEITFWLTWILMMLLSIYLCLDSDRNITLAIVCGYLLCLKLFCKFN